MALQVWLPLDGTLENKGCTNISIKNYDATVNTSGKIGSCYSFNGYVNYLMGTPAIFNNDTEEWSYACWLKPTVTHTGCLFSNRTKGTSTGISVFYYSNTIIFDDGIRWQFTPSKAITVGEWNHIVFTRSLSGKKFYLNGELINQTSDIGTPTNANASFFSIGGSQSSTSVNDNWFNGQLNDVRIYDHCLSAAEVKEISQGLVLHYKLSPYYNIEVLSNWLYETSEKSVSRSSSSNARIDYVFDPRLKSTTDTSFTANFDAKGTANNMVIDIYFRDASGGINISSTRTLTTEWAHYTITFTSTVATAYVFSIRLYSGTNNDIAYFKNVKVTSDNMPIIDTKIIDSSGYGHHGIIKNVISYSTDTPKYEKSLYTPRNSAINCGRGAMVTDSITVNLWAKWSTWDHPVSCTEGGGWNFENTPVNFALYLSGNGYITNQNGYAVASSQPSANEWHMLTGVYDRLNHKTLLYIDGELSDEKDTNITNLIGYHGSNVIWLGGEASGSATDFANANYVGNLSDFRIYCTPLSAEDIKQLYNTSAKIDKTGKLHTFELVEDTGLKITKTGITKTEELIEDGTITKFNNSYISANEFIER